MKLSKNVINQIKKYPVKLLQNIEKEKVEFIYYVDEIDKDYIYLLPNAGYCLGNPPINNRS